MQSAGTRGITGSRQLQIAEGQIGRIVALQAEVARLQALTFARVIIGGAFVGPVDDLNSVDPGGEMRAIGHQHRCKPFAIAGDHSARMRSAKDRSRAVIVRLSPVAVLETALNLEFVTIGGGLFRARHGAEKDAAVQLVAVGDRFELQHEVSGGLFRFQETSTVRDVNRPVLDREFALGTGNYAPASQRLPVKQRRRSQRLQIHVAELDLAAVHLQSDDSRL